MNTLPILMLDGKKYYIDYRLDQIRSVDNPKEYITIEAVNNLFKSARLANYFPSEAPKENNVY